MSASAKTFETPFSREYWARACGELKNTRVMVFAAIITALRVAVKVFSIPVVPLVNITFGFFFNALGSMVYGPVVGLLCGAVSDTLGCMIHPVGPYFFPFIFSEMLGSFIFGIFLYRTKITPMRVVWSRFSVTVLCNLIVDPICMMMFNQIMYGKPYKLFTVPRLIKNITLFPAQAVLLILFLAALLPLTNRLGITSSEPEELEVRKKHIATIAILTVVAALLVAFYNFVYLPSRA